MWAREWSVTIWNKTRPRAPVENQQTRDLINWLVGNVSDSHRRRIQCHPQTEIRVGQSRDQWRSPTGPRRCRFPHLRRGTGLDTNNNNDNIHGMWKRLKVHNAVRDYSHRLPAHYTYVHMLQAVGMLCNTCLESVERWDQEAENRGIIYTIIIVCFHYS